MSTTARIAAKGCTNTGLTEDHAKTLHDSLGKTVIAIVELTSEARTENKAGDEAVKLSIGMIEVAPDGIAADHVRELARSFHYERRLTEDGPTLTDSDGPEPKVGDVLAAGARFRPHPYLASTLSTDDNAICDVCGSTEAAAVHSIQDVLPDDDSDDETGDDGDGDPAEPHEFEQGPDDSCLHCGQAEHEDYYVPDGREHDDHLERGDHPDAEPTEDDDWAPTIPSPFTTPTPA